MRRYGRGRYKPGVMNTLESKYATFLEMRRRMGEIEWFAFEAIKFRLAEKTFYTPDFIVMDKDGFLEAHEVKGFWEDDARVKIKCAAEKFPLKFIGIRAVKGQWDYEQF